MLIKKDKMKTVLTKFLAISGIGLLMLASCKKEGTLVKSNGGKPGDLTANATTLPLDRAKVNDTTKVITFNFTKANFGYSAAVTNSLQIDAQGDNWANPTSFTLPVGTFKQGFSTFDFNNLVLKLNLPAGVASQVNVRVVHSLGVNVPPVYSNTLALTVTPFNLTAWLYATGAFSGWQNPGPLQDSLISVTGNGIYTGIINFNATTPDAKEFLILPAKKWDHKYATTEPKTATTTTVTYDAGNNIVAPGNGQYIVTFNSNTGAITFTAADYYSIIGSAPPGTAWQNDYPMKYVNDGNGTWVANNVPMTVGEYKFRQDNQWANSWGPTATAGTATDNGPIGDGNLQLTVAGNYNLTFTMPATPYGTKPPDTAPYTAVKQ